MLNCRTGNCTAGSNPAPTATNLDRSNFSSVSGILGSFILLGVPAGVLTLRPRERRDRLLALLALPVAGGLAWMAIVLQAANWDLFLPRYLYPAIPGFALLAALALGRVRDGRLLLPVATTLTVLLSGWWIYLAGVEPVTG